MNESQNHHKFKSNRKLAIIVAVIVLLAIAAAVYIAPGLFLPDGTEKFTGVKQEVAKMALSFEHMNSRISPMPEYMQQIHVDGVRAISSDEKSKYCTNPDYVSDDPNDIRYYAVEMSIHKPGADTKSVTGYACDWLQFDFGYIK
jgi:hypothetical protein